ncbi:MAG: NADH-quinone oxidoreductase subunit L [Betaproteobacteria bacterium AqS2]|uniref:NADH-quinone oxidoreductase subunit L n=1 Tax=Candidatus Amphirhobacter heronislandensis TaxID=1732024 RepID=A0A930XXX3_9GAMM|nr:NADH-quinone oxidoreductase subunit L [Betaproteobacteria bacterium AqS2]
MEGWLHWIVLAPLLAALACGFGGKALGRMGAAAVANAAVAFSFVLSALVAWEVFAADATYAVTWYEWARGGGQIFAIGFLVDGLTATMLLVVTSVSLMVHVYTIGYMHDDPGFQRFFSYIALFTFAMLMLVMSDNFLQLFFGWEAVGLVSYLLIGFWFKKPTAIHANLKAFLVNRVGDFGFLIGIGLVLAYCGSLDYAEVFARREALAGAEVELIPGFAWGAATVACVALFIGAMGKSAQLPLHVWLPDSMEGPTPISALIHAATMVTAGIFMVARLAPLFEMSPAALAFILVIGALTAFSMGLLGLVQNDIKRVVAYSTLSQLGYMTAALGASAYGVAIFHLTTHAFFKALLFLGAGAVIVALHHEQDMRRMGGLVRRMPITHAAMVAGSLALCGIPPLAGFFSKDLIIEAVRLHDGAGAGLAYVLLLLAAVATSFYSFRLLAVVFYGETRMEAKDYGHVKDCAWTITVPLVVLAVLSVVAGFALMTPLLGASWFTGAGEAVAASSHAPEVAAAYPSPWSLLGHAWASPVLYLAVAGVAAPLYLYLKAPDLLAKIAGGMGPLRKVLERKYGFDDFNQLVFANGARGLGRMLWRGFDAAVIDGFVDGLARTVAAGARLLRGVQTGRIYHYAFVMIISIAIVLPWLMRSGG